MNTKGAVIGGPGGHAYIGGVFGSTPTTQAAHPVGWKGQTKLTTAQAEKLAKAYAADPNSKWLYDAGPKGPDDKTYHPQKNPNYQTRIGMAPATTAAQPAAPQRTPDPVKSGSAALAKPRAKLPMPVKNRPAAARPRPATKAKLPARPSSRGGPSTRSGSVRRPRRKG